MSNTILIIGATGNIGGHLVKLLSDESSVNIIATSRLDENVASFKHSGINAVKADLNHLESFKPILDSCDKVFLNSTFSPELPELHTAFIDLCKQKSIKHLVRVSALGAGLKTLSPLSQLTPSQVHTQVEQHLESSGIPYTHIRPNFFMENLLAYLPEMTDTGLFHGAFGGGEISLINTYDIAAVAKAVLLSNKHANVALEITGAQSYSMHEVADYFSTKLNRSIKYRDVSVAEIRDLLRQKDLPEPAVQGIANMQECFSQGHAAVITQTVKQLTHRQPLTLEKWISDLIIPH